jgi:hypothetical protein
MSNLEAHHVKASQLGKVVTDRFTPVSCLGGGGDGVVELQHLCLADLCFPSSSAGTRHVEERETCGGKRDK